MSSAIVVASATYVIKYIIISILLIIINAVQLAMFIRAILSWFRTGSDSKFIQLLYFITEPFIKPIRKLLNKINLFQRLPIDISFLVTYILLSFISAILSSFIL